MLRISASFPKISQHFLSNVNLYLSLLKVQVLFVCQSLCDFTQYSFIAYSIEILNSIKVNVKLKLAVFDQQWTNYY